MLKFKLDSKFSVTQKLVIIHVLIIIYHFELLIAII